MSAPQVTRAGRVVAAGLLALTCACAGGGVPAWAGAPTGWDFNGDGLPEFAAVVGGAEADRLLIVTDDGSAHRLLAPPPVGEGFTSGRMAAGDFDGDGYADLAAGVPGGTAGAVTDAGFVYVYYGGHSGLTGFSGNTKPQVFHQGTSGVGGAPERGDGFGSSLAAGDFDGDGWDDLAVGVPGENHHDLTDAGSVMVFRGSVRGLNPAEDVTITESTPGIRTAARYGEYFGRALAAADITGDRRTDLVVTAPHESDSDGGLGGVHVIPGGARGLVPSKATWASGHSTTVGSFGDFVATGDINGDGRADIVVNDPMSANGAGVQCGAIEIYRGTAQGVTATGRRRITQSTSQVVGACEDGDRWGDSLAVGDLTGDGKAEVVVGAPDEALGEHERAGAYTVLRGSASGVVTDGSFAISQASANVPGTPEDGDWFARSLALQDLDGDGRLDVLVASEEGVTGTNSAGGISGLLSASTGRPRAGGWNLLAAHIGTEDDPIFSLGTLLPGPAG